MIRFRILWRIPALTTNLGDPQNRSEWFATKLRNYATKDRIDEEKFSQD
jgi:hypothetical protein